MEMSINNSFKEREKETIVGKVGHREKGDCCLWQTGKKGM